MNRLACRAALVAAFAILCAPAPAQTPFAGVKTTPLYHFSKLILHEGSPASNADGAYPDTPALQGKDGFFYGVANEGGEAGDGGTLWRYANDTLIVLHTFRQTQYSHDGYYPQGALIQARDGRIYGTTNRGGVNNAGTIFRYNPDNKTYAVIYSFTVNGQGGSYVSAGLTEGPDGTLYGTTLEGGAHNGGTVYKINPQGPAHKPTTLYSFPYSFATQHDYTYKSLLLAADGMLYGATGNTAYRINPQTGAYTLVYKFHNDGLRRIASPLIQGTDGALYGTRAHGGNGDFYRIDLPTFAVTILHHFTYQKEGGPSTVVQERDGNFYGATSYPRNILWRYDPSTGEYTALAKYGPQPEIVGLTVMHDSRLFGVGSQETLYPLYSKSSGVLFRVDLGL